MEDRTCKDCKHFVQHYYIKGANLLEVDCGFCLKKRGRDYPIKVCNKYEEKEEQNKEIIVKSIDSLVEKLEKCVMILKK